MPGGRGSRALFYEPDAPVLIRLDGGIVTSKKAVSGHCIERASAMAKKSAIRSASKAPALPAFTANKDSQFSFLTGSDFPEKHNVAWRIEIAQDDVANPLFEPKYPWDLGSIASYGTVLLDPTDDLW